MTHDVATCIHLVCSPCAEGVPLIAYENDENLYHTTGAPCRAYRIRRHFGQIPQEVTNWRTYAGLRKE